MIVRKELPLYMGMELIHRKPAPQPYQSSGKSFLILLIRKKTLCQNITIGSGSVSRVWGAEIDSQITKVTIWKSLPMTISFVRTNRKTNRETNRQTDKHPQSCSENQAFGKTKQFALRQLDGIFLRLSGTLCGVMYLWIWISLLQITLWLLWHPMSLHDICDTMFSKTRYICLFSQNCASNVDFDL